MKSIIRNFLAKLMAGRSDDGIMITLKNPQKIEMAENVLMDVLIRNGINPDSITSETQLKNILNQIDAVNKQSLKTAQSSFKDTPSAEVFDLKGKKIKNTDNIIGGDENLDYDFVETSEGYVKVPGSKGAFERFGEKNKEFIDKSAANIIADDLPPPGSRGGPEDIAAPVQTPEEYLKNVIEGENKKNIAKIKQRQTMLNEAIDDASPGFSGDRKVDADLVAENLAERMGLVYDDLPTKQKIDLYDQAYTGLSKKKFDPPEDFATGGRAGYKFGIGPIKKLLDFANKKSPMQAYKDYLKSVKARTLKANETGKFKDLPLEVIPVAAGGGLLTSALRKKLKAMSKEDVERKKERDDEADGGRIGFKAGLSKLLKEFMERRKFLKTMVGNTEKNRKARELEMLKKAIEEARENPGFEFPSGQELRTEIEKKIGPILLKDRKLNADGGRIGLKDGPKFDVQASGTKSGKQQIQNAPEGFTIDKETFNAIIKADIPLSEKIDLLASYQYGKGRDRIEKDDQELFLSEGGFKDRNIGFGFNKDNEGIGGTLMYNMETGKPRLNIGFKKSFAKGGIARIGLKDGMNRRTFLKLLGGAASIPIVGKFFKVGKVGKTMTTVPVIKTADVPGKPEWFDALVNKVILEGDDVTKRFATKEREIVHMKVLDEGTKAKKFPPGTPDSDDTSIIVTQDLDQGAIQVEYRSPENLYGDPVQLQYKKPLPDEGAPKPAAEFDTAESVPVARADDPDGNFDIEIEEGGGQSISDLTSDVSKLKEYATGKKPTLKEIVQTKKRKDQTKAITEGEPEQYEFMEKRQGLPFVDYPEPDDYPFASGGIAKMLGE